MKSRTLSRKVGAEINTPRSDKLWRDAILRAVKRRKHGKDDPQYLDKLASRLVSVAMAGEVGAIKEIGDRLDGKPAQAQEHSGPGGTPIPMKIEVVFVKSGKRPS